VPDRVVNLAHAMRKDAAREVGGCLSERALLAPCPDEEARAWTALMDSVGAENRRRVLKGAPSLSEEEQTAVAKRLFDDIFRLGPLQLYLDQEDVEEVIANGAEVGFVVRSGGRKERVDLGLSDEELRSLTVRAASRAGRRLDDASPAVDVQLPDGARLHAVVPPLVNRPCLTVRRHRLAAQNLDELMGMGTISAEAAIFPAQGGALWPEPSHLGRDRLGKDHHAARPCL
jgi:pilus assembly protein CpaF